MVLMAAILTGTGLAGLSVVTGLWSALIVATLFAWGVAFFFPTMVGLVSERMPRTGSLGIVLMAGVGLGMSGIAGVPAMGRIADYYLAEALKPDETIALLERVKAEYPAYLERAATGSAGYNADDVKEALEAADVALAEYGASGRIQGDDTANALRAVIAARLPEDPLAKQAASILQPAEAYGGQRSFRYVAPLALVLIAVFGTMYVRDRQRGGYKVVRLERAGEEG
jgi:hypothetical protein